MSAPVAPQALPCSTCGTQLSPSLLSCPSCHALVHAPRLKELAAAAQRATDAGDATGALEAWREAHDLLPPSSKQYAVVADRIDKLSRHVSFAPSNTSQAAPKHGSAFKRGWAAVSAIALIALSKAKLLLLGLTKLGTLSSMLVFLGVYWGLYGWKFALGFVVCIYIHEMGHVASLARYGIKASAPMFIPGFGALVRLRQAPANVHEDARVGLAGPVWGTGAGLAAWLIGAATGAPIWLAIAHTAGWLNLFNLLPVWQLDGGRGFRAFSRTQRWMAVAFVGAAFAVTREPLFVIVGLGAGWNAFRAAPDDPDWGALGLFGGLIAVLAWLIAGTSHLAGAVR
jgi:Zn-dependent protease